MRALEQMRRDINLIGCMSDADILNGSTAERAKPPAYVKTLCEENGIPENEPIGSIARRYCDAIHGFVSGDMSEEDMWGIIRSRACVRNQRR
jgi:hypothetical protein